MGCVLEPRDFHGTCEVRDWLWPSVCHGSGPCSSLPQDHRQRLETLPWVGVSLSTPTACPLEASAQRPGAESCARARGRRRSFSHLLPSPSPSLELGRISSLGLEVNKDRRQRLSSGPKHKEWQSLPPVVNELERKAVRRTNKAEFQSCPAVLIWRL